MCKRDYVIYANLTSTYKNTASLENLTCFEEQLEGFSTKILDSEFIHELAVFGPKKFKTYRFQAGVSIDKLLSGITSKNPVMIFTNVMYYLSSAHIC